MNNNKIKYCFICSPGLGILENWLPILYELKKHNPKAEFICLITKNASLEHISSVSVLIQVASEIFDDIVFKTFSNLWVKADSFSNAAELNRSSFLPAFLNKHHVFFSRFFIRHISKIISYIYQYGDKLKKKNLKVDLKELMNEVDVVLYDISEERKGYVSEILKYFKGPYKFSLHHGVDVFKNKKKLEPKELCTKTKITHYAFSNHDIEYFKSSYSLNVGDIVVAGIPRLENKWMEFIYNKQLNMEKNIEWEDYIFVISRSMSDYLPYNKKRIAIENIKELAFVHLKKKLVIKLHPKEANHSLYEKVLGKENYGEKWVYSNLHPYILSSKCVFVIAFYTNLVFDMIIKKVPVIEYLDLKNIEGYDNNESLRDKENNPVFDFRYNGLVLGASDLSQLKTQANRIMQERDSVMRYLHNNYVKMFAQKDTPISFITKDILNKANLIFTD